FKDDGAGNLTINPTTGTGCAAIFPLNEGLITDLEFAVDSGDTATANTVVLDQTSRIFNCFPIGGTVGTSGNNDGIVKILAAANEPVTVGSNGVNLDDTLPGNALCGGAAFTSGTFSGLQTYQVVEAGTPANPAQLLTMRISAGGQDGTG